MEIRAHEEYCIALNIHDSLWKDLARAVRFIEGDINTSYFYKIVSIKEATKLITLLNQWDVVLNTPAIEEHILNYFRSILLHKFLTCKRQFPSLV